MKWKQVLAISLLCIILPVIFFHNLGSTAFIFGGDEYASLSLDESREALFVQQQVDFGSAYSTITLVTLFDRLFYLGGYSLGFATSAVQFLFFSVKIATLLILGLYGLSKLSSLISSSKNQVTLFLITVFYAFNSFTLVYWHGTAFSYTALLAYAIAPLALYSFLTILLNKANRSSLLLFILSLFLMSFTVYFFAVFLIILCGYTIFYILSNTSQIKRIVISILYMVLLYLPFAALNFFYLFDMFFNPIESVNMSGGETYGILQGGLLYPLFMWFSWAIYVIWTPRSIYSFYEYFYAAPAIIAPFVVYGLAFYKIHSNLKKGFIVATVLLLLFFLFIIKGAQEPFGEVYIFLIENIPIFRVFRSPDSKIGFGIILMITVLLVMNRQNIRDRLFTVLLSFVIIVQGFLIFSGIAIRGQNTETSEDRIMRITHEYKEIADFFNSQKEFGYVLTDPGSDYAHFDLGEGERHIGQDLLGKIVRLPFTTVSESGGITRDAFELLQQLKEGESFDSIQFFPIHYVLIRRDNLQTDPNPILLQQFTRNWEKVYESRLFTVFENPSKTGIIRSKNTTFKMVNPIEYHIEINAIKDHHTLVFLQSFNRYWSLYPTTDSIDECGEKVQYIESDTYQCLTQAPTFKSYLSLLNTQQLFDNSHEKALGYANKWSITKEEIIRNAPKESYSMNPDGTIDIKLRLVFKIQAYFNLAMIMATIYAIGLIIFMLINKYYAKK